MIASNQPSIAAIASSRQCRRVRQLLFHTPSAIASQRATGTGLQLISGDRSRSTSPRRQFGTN